MYKNDSDTDEIKINIKKIEKKILKKLEKHAAGKVKELEEQVISLSQHISQIEEVLKDKISHKNLNYCSENAEKCTDESSDCIYRCEIIANQSVLEDVTEVLETAVPDILYTIFPMVHGRGGNDRKLGNITWPETNFVLVSYTDKSNVMSIRRAVAAVKQRFKDEGIKLFVIVSDV